MLAFSQDKPEAGTVTRFAPSVRAEEHTMTQEEFLKKAEEYGSWIIYKSAEIILSDDLTEKDLKPLGNDITSLIAGNIIPQALDRNPQGELLIVSQLSPPATPTKTWELGVYQSEKEMMDSLETHSKEGWYPTGMDVNDDGAFVIYVRKNELIHGARLVKITKFEDVSSTVQAYYDLEYLPATITTFRDSLWIFFTQSYVKDENTGEIVEQDISKIDIIIKTVKGENINNALTEVLTQKNTSLIDVTFTLDDKALLLFTKILE